MLARSLAHQWYGIAMIMSLPSNLLAGIWILTLLLWVCDALDECMLDASLFTRRSQGCWTLFRSMFMFTSDTFVQYNNWLYSNQEPNKTCWKTKLTPPLSAPAETWILIKLSKVDLLEDSLNTFSYLEHQCFDS